MEYYDEIQRKVSNTLLTGVEMIHIVFTIKDPSKQQMTDR